MTGAKDDPLAAVSLSRTILDGLALAVERYPGAPLGTLHILTAISAVDVHGGWEALQLRSTYLAPEDVTRLADPDLRATAHWGGMALTASAAAALRTATEIACRHDLEPMPAGVLVLGLLWDPSYAASRALLEESTIGHSELLACVQEELLGVNLDLKRDETEHPPAGRLAQLGSAERHPARASASAPVVSIAAAAHLRARAIEVDEDPGSLALLIAALELNAAQQLNELLAAMLLDPEVLTALLPELSELPDTPAVDVLVRAKARTEGPLDAAAVIAAVALADSPRLNAALRLRGISSREVAAQMTEWFVSRTSPPETTPRMLLTSLLTLASGVATSVLLLINAAETGTWLKALLLIPAWIGYPQEGPVFGSVLAVVLGLLVSPLVAIAQGVSVLCEIAQADAERFARWARTGVRLTLREQRHVTMRLLNERGRMMRQIRQSILAYTRSRERTEAA